MIRGIIYVTVIDKLQGNKLRIRISRVGTETIVIPVEAETYDKARLGSVGTINALKSDKPRKINFLKDLIL
jgi:hypothetical protein